MLELLPLIAQVESVSLMGVAGSGSPLVRGASRKTTKQRMFTQIEPDAVRFHHIGPSAPPVQAAINDCSRIVRNPAHGAIRFLIDRGNLSDRRHATQGDTLRSSPFWRRNNYSNEVPIRILLAL